MSTGDTWNCGYRAFTESILRHDDVDNPFLINTYRLRCMPIFNSQNIWSLLQNQLQKASKPSSTSTRLCCYRIFPLFGDHQQSKEPVHPFLWKDRQMTASVWVRIAWHFWTAIHITPIETLTVCIASFSAYKLSPCTFYSLIRAWPCTLSN